MSTRDGELDQVDADGEPPEFDLTPREPGAVGGRPRRKVGAVILLVLVAAAVVLILSQALGSATQYFYTADQAVAQRASLGTRRFRIEGTVVNTPVRLAEGQLQRADFTIMQNGVSVPVVYVGEDPPALFKKCEPVVLVGAWNGTTFHSDQIIVKHTETYTEQHPGRLAITCPKVTA